MQVQGSTYKVLDVDTWDRNEQYHFFRHFDQPFFGFTANLDLTALFHFARDASASLFAHYLFASQKAVNSIPAFRYRMQADQVVEFARVSAGTSILKENQVFTFCNFPYEPDLGKFLQQVSDRIQRSQKAATPLFEAEDELDQIYYSVIPWIHFTNVNHPRKQGDDNSVPRIVFGKVWETGGRWVMPISVEVHHALLDGYQVGIYYERLQNYFDDPKSLGER